MSGRGAWAARGLGLVTFTSLIGASTGVSGNGAISGQARITQPGTYTVGRNIDLAGSNLGAGVPVIDIALAGGEVVLDLDGHTVKRGPGGPVIAISCGTGGNEGSAGCAVTIRDGKLESGSVNVRATDTALTLERVTAAGAQQDGVRITGGSLRVTSSMIRDAGANGIWGDSSTCGVDDSVIANTGASGLALQEATQMELRGTVIRNAGAHGVSIIEEIPIPSYGALLDDVRVLGSGQDGVHVDGDVPLTITGGLVRGSGGHGVIVGNNEHPVRIERTKILDTAGPAAIYMEIGGASVQVVDTQVRDFAGAGIACVGTAPGTSIVLERNLIASAGTTVDVYPLVGFRMDDASTLRILDNTIEGTAVGMQIGSPGALVARNQLRMMRTGGIEVLSAGVVVRDNLVAGSAGAAGGIFTDAGGRLLYAKGNQVRGFLTGLQFAPGTTVDAQGYARGNTLVGNGTAIVGGVDAGGNIL